MHTGYYDDLEWQSLSSEQWLQVLEARGTKRNISTVTINNLQRGEDLMSAITDVPGTVTPQENVVNPRGGNAGAQSFSLFTGKVVA